MIRRIAGIILGAVLFTAAVTKSGDMAATVNAIRLGLGVSAEASHILTTGLIFGEILLGSWLISGYRARGAVVAGAVLFGAFMLWNASFLIRGIRADCGCGFSAGNPSLERGQWIATIRAGLFGLVGVVGLVSGRAVNHRELEPHTRKEMV